LILRAKNRLVNHNNMDVQEKKKEEISELLVQAYGKARLGYFEESEQILEKALSLDFEDQEIVASMKCINFWKDRERILTNILDPFEKGEFLIKEWKAFLVFLKRLENNYEKSVYAIRQYLFGQALFNYMRLYNDDGSSDTEILYRLALCYKGLGNYGKALEFLERASHQRVDDPVILSELADCYAFVNELRAAKVFFREAFFIDPQRIDILSLESLLIQRLIERITEMGHKSPELEEWIPVYGVLYSVFTVKRELRPLEYGKLKQEIYSLESRLQENPQDTLTVPRLINKYFWLIDHYIVNKESREKVEEILEKIKKINESVYELYTK